MERQLLGILDFDLSFTEEDAIEAWADFMPRRSSSPRQDRETRQSAVNLLKRRSSHMEVEMPITPPHDAVPPSLSSILGKQQSSLPTSSSASGYLDVPLSSDGPAPPSSPISSGSSPLLDLSMSRCTTTESEISMGSLMDDTGSSGCSEGEESDDHNVLIIPNKAHKTHLKNASRISFALPSKPPLARPGSNRNRASSYNVGQAQSWQSSSTSTVSNQSSSSMSTHASMPRIRDSASGGFLSRVFGSSSSTKEKLSKLGTADHTGSGEVLIASQSTSMDASLALKDYRIRHPKPYVHDFEGESNYSSL